MLVFRPGLLVAVLVTVASLAILGPSIAEAQRQINFGLTLIQNLYFVTMKSDASVYTDRLFHPASSVRQAAVLAISLRAYVLTAVAVGLTLFFTKIRHLPALNQVLALTLCAVLLPPLSNDYTLIHMLLPLSLLCFYAVEAWRERRSIPGFEGSFACLCLILGFGTFFTMQYAFSNTIRCFALTALLVIAMRYPFYWSELDSLDATGAEFAPTTGKVSET